MVLRRGLWLGGGGVKVVPGGFNIVCGSNVSSEAGRKVD